MEVLKEKNTELHDDLFGDLTGPELIPKDEQPPEMATASMSRVDVTLAKAKAILEVLEAVALESQGKRRFGRFPISFLVNIWRKVVAALKSNNH